MTEDSKPFHYEQTSNENLHPAQPQIEHQQELFPDGPLTGLDGPDRWKAILQLAEHAGRRAEEKCRPPLLAVRRHMPKEGEPEITYMPFQGSAAICALVDRRSRFGKWLVKQADWSCNEVRGVYRYVGNRQHSLARAAAFAAAFVAVMREYGIWCGVEEWPD